MKKYSHSRHYGNRLNWRALVISLTIIFCLTAANYGNADKVYVAEKPKVEAFLLPVVVDKEETIEEKIKFHFPRSWRDMIAIAHAESRMDPEAKNWNCFYNSDKSIVYETRVKGAHSTFCKKEHRKYAWSVDCGIMQLSVRSKECPVEDIDTHLQKAAELSKIQGKEAWVVYQTGAYKKYLTSK